MNLMWWFISLILPSENYLLYDNIFLLKAHSYLVSYFKGSIAHIFARIFYEKIIQVCSSRTELEFDKQNPFIIPLLEVVMRWILSMRCYFVCCDRVGVELRFWFDRFYPNKAWCNKIRLHLLSICQFPSLLRVTCNNL